MPIPRLEVPTSARTELVDITERVSRALRQAGARSGAVLVFCPHTTAGIAVQENADPDVRHDLLLALENAVPARAARGAYRHAEGNTDAHVKSALVGTSQWIPVEDGRLVLGTWQGIYLWEFDGPRQRQVHLTFLPA
jgi:secondary thiamine-phosphate synthase enzyme